MRVAIRRLRAMMRAARELLAPEWSEPLRAELRWLGGELGPLRDADVFIEYLRGEAAGMDERDQAGAAGRRARQRPIASRRMPARSKHCAAGATSPCWRSWSGQRAHRVRSATVPSTALRARSSRSFARRRSHGCELARRRRARAPDPRQARQVPAELAATASGPAVRAFVKESKDFQDVVGEHQDAVVAEEPPARARRAGARGGLVAGVLIERQRERRRRLESDLPGRGRRLRKSAESAWSRATRPFARPARSSCAVATGEPRFCWFTGRSTTTGRCPRGRASAARATRHARSARSRRRRASAVSSGRASAPRTTFQWLPAQDVRYWAMTQLGGEFVPGREVDEIRWLDPEAAAALLTHRRDARVLGSLLDLGCGALVRAARALRPRGGRRRDAERHAEPALRLREDERAGEQRPRPRRRDAVLLAEIPRGAVSDEQLDGALERLRAEVRADDFAQRPCAAARRPALPSAAGGEPVRARARPPARPLRSPRPPAGRPASERRVSRSEPTSKERAQAGPPAGVPTTICVEPPPTSHTATPRAAPDAADRARVAEPPSSSAARSADRRPLSRARAPRRSSVGVGALAARRGHQHLDPVGAELTARAAAAAPRRPRTSAQRRLGQAPLPLDLLAEAELHALLAHASRAPSALRSATSSRSVFAPDVDRLRPARSGILARRSAVRRRRGRFKRFGRLRRRVARARAAHQRRLRGTSRARPSSGATRVQAPSASSSQACALSAEQRVEDARRSRACARGILDRARRSRSGGRGCAASGRRCRGSTSRSPPCVEDEDAAVLEEAAEHAADADRLAQPGDARPQRADAARDDVDRARPACDAS